jgi:hypothetical protein
MHALHDVPAGVCQQRLHVAAAGLLFAFKHFDDDARRPSSRRDAPPVANTFKIQKSITLHIAEQQAMEHTEQLCFIRCVLHSTSPAAKLYTHSRLGNVWLIMRFLTTITNLLATVSCIRHDKTQQKTPGMKALGVLQH